MEPAPPETLRAEVVVIGSGAGGAPAAAALAEAGLDVVLLEAGERLSAADFSGEEGPMLARLMHATLARDSGMDLYAGRCVGGSTVVNDALCWPTPAEVLAEWRDEHGLRGLSDASFAPYVERVWQDVHASPTGRSYLSRNAHRLELGAARLGWAAEAMARNVRGCARLGLCNLGCPTNAKQSTLLAYVPRAERAGTRVLASTRARRIEVESGAVRAVEAERIDPATGEPRAALRIETEQICVAAGVLETPALLLRSGLRAGANLQFHSSAYVTARFREPIYGYYGPTMAYAVSEFSDVNGHGGPGFMLEHVTTAPVPTASGLPGFGADHERAMAALPHLARAVVVLRDRTRGRLSLESDGTPRIDYDPTPEDLARLRTALAALARAYLAADALEVWLPVHGLPPVRSEADLAALDRVELTPRTLSLLYAVHLFGGASMAGSREAGFCDETGRAFDVRGLYVSDAAALPGNTGVNPQVTIMANALRVADALAHGRRSGP